jgi:hypothetical protein
LCVDHGIPIYSKFHDGNESDKTINRNLIPEMVKRMRQLGRRDFIYVKDKETSRPTSFMMTTKLVGIFVLVTQGQRRLAKPLRPVQLHYLTLLELTPEIFTTPVPESRPPCGMQRKFTQNSS